MKLRDWAHWEKYPWYIFYAPLLPVWAWFCIRARAVWFFTASNPTITFGGFEGEGKREIYEQLPPGSYPHTMYVQPDEDFAALTARVKAEGFTFPFAAKPDVGMGGVFFRKIETTEQLAAYHQIIPVEYLIQEWIDYPMEVSVFYCRIPGSSSGEITGITRRDLLQVTGDGQSTLWQLTLNNPWAQPYLTELKKKYNSLLDWVIPAGENYKLFHAANRNRGAQLVNLLPETDAELVRFFDRLCDLSGAFYYGRYDIKCHSLQELQQGKNFTILEYNGAGAGSNHIYHRGLTLSAAYLEVIRHWNYLFEISRRNHRAGVPYWPLLKGIRFLRAARRQYIMLKKTDASF